MIYQLANGLFVTVSVVALSFLLALVLAFPLGIAKDSLGRTVRLAIGGYVQIFRGTSILVQLFYAYYVLPLVGIYLPAFTTAVLVLALNTAAYGTEVVRSSLAAIPRGQHEAGASLGLSRPQSFRLVILPQAAASLIAGFSNLLVDLLKATPLIAFITVRDVSFEAKSLYQTYGHPMLLYSFLLVVFFLMGKTSLQAGRLLMTRSSRWRQSRGAS